MLRVSPFDYVCLLVVSAVTQPMLFGLFGVTYSQFATSHRPCLIKGPTRACGGGVDRDKRGSRTRRWGGRREITLYF